MSKLGELYYGTKNYLHSIKTAKEVRRIINAFIEFSKNHHDPDFQEANSYYSNGGKSPFPYEPSISFNPPTVYNDGHPYILHNNKKLYFPRNYDDTTIIRTYKGMVLEQDKSCPHCYTQNEFNVPTNAILVDLGCAEAMFSLDHIDSISKLYLVETKPEWVKALKLTFEPWEDKVEIIHKYASDKTNANELCLNDLFDNVEGKRFYVKMDIEGFEQKVLNGAQKFLNSNNKIQLAIATYHNQEDYDHFNNHLTSLGYEVNHTAGFILFYYDRSIQSPFLRRCVLQANN